MNLQPLIETVIHHPYDAGPMLVLADALSETGDAREGVVRAWVDMWPEIEATVAKADSKYDPPYAVRKLARTRNPDIRTLLTIISCRWFPCPRRTRRLKRKFAVTFLYALGLVEFDRFLEYDQDPYRNSSAAQQLAFNYCVVNYLTGKSPRPKALRRAIQSLKQQLKQEQR